MSGKPKPRFANNIFYTTKTGWNCCTFRYGIPRTLQTLDTINTWKTILKKEKNMKYKFRLYPHRNTKDKNIFWDLRVYSKPV